MLGKEVTNRGIIESLGEKTESPALRQEIVSIY